ncbi:hypothetical protein JTE90_018160 [Oedothorax gibbosus]|uniref:Uncharacterized protein n=1 Tax=Oedothorax gibbosus TaxID=931172 RepID=A0AAV6U8G3_9ARAC|nr:hypothetical protein JTE90_018160 [Oedothorax gibbosus]
MGEPSLKTHAKGAKHQKLVKNGAKKFDLKSFFPTQNPGGESSSQPIASHSVLPTSVAHLDKCVNVNNLSIKAEILWALKVLNLHYSYKSCEDEIEKKKFTRPTSKSFEILQDIVKDELFSVKCNFLLSICKDIDPF